MVNHWEVVALREQGWTLAEIGARVGVSHQRISQILDAAGVPRIGRLTSRVRRSGALGKAVERYTSGEWKSVAQAAAGKVTENQLYAELRRLKLLRERPASPHGTRYRYDTGCRCTECRAVNAARTKRLRKARVTRGGKH